MTRSKVVAVAVHAGDWPDPAVARAAGVSRHAVQRWRQRWGIPPALPVEAPEPSGKAKRRPDGKHPSSWIRADKRWAIYARDAGYCAWCGLPDACESLDHIWPRARATLDAQVHHPRWLVTCCLACNHRRKQLRISDWLRRLRTDGADMLAVAARLNRRRLPISIPEGRQFRKDVYARLAPKAHDESELDALGVYSGADGALY